MSARDDYPIGYTGQSAWTEQRPGDHYEAMCDEIDQWRHESMDALMKLHQALEIKDALDELVSTLTTHADAMRALITELDTEIEQTGEAANMARYSQNEKAIKKVLKAYDALVKEC